MNKKAQGMSVNMIILIVLGLIILGVLVYMISGKVSQFGSSANNCLEKKGECKAPKECEGSIIGQMDCPEGNSCCVVFEDTK